MIIHSLSPEGEWPDAATLATCARTCKDWNQTAVKLLYNRIDISRREDYLLLEGVLRSNESLSSRVNILSVQDLTSIKRISTTVLHTPQRLAELRQLFIFDTHWEDTKDSNTFPYRPSFLATLRQFRSLLNIYLHRLKVESLDELRKMLGSLPSLESAIFRNVLWKNPNLEFKPLFNATSWRLCLFSLSDCTSDFTAPFFWAMPPPSARKAQQNHCHPAICRQDVEPLMELAKCILNPFDPRIGSICWEWKRVGERNNCNVSSYGTTTYRH